MSLTMTVSGRQMFVQLVGLAVWLVGGVGGALACTICFSAVSVTTGQKLDAAAHAVLAAPLPDGAHFLVVETVKGDVAAGAYVEGTANLDPEVLQDGRLVLLVRNELSQQWMGLGAIGPEYADWLRQLVRTNDGRRQEPRLAGSLFGTMQAGSDTTNRPQRIFLVEQFFESVDPFAAEIAFEEFSRAPYSAMRLLKPVLEPAGIRARIDDPEFAARRDANLLLLGIAGTADDAAVLEAHLAKARASHDATNVAAMLVADLELRGPGRVPWIEENYLVDGNRTLPEIRAALLALSVQGKVDARIPRRRIIDAYRLFIRERRPMAGFVAADLTDWQAWDVASDYIEVLEANAVKDPASQFAIAMYLQASPDAGARAVATAYISNAN